MARHVRECNPYPRIVTQRQPPYYSRMRIAITGGAGFLGRALIDSLQNSGHEITAISRDEHKHHRLKAHYPKVHTALCDVRDEERLRALFVGHDAVIHAAALKYVPESERDVSEAVATNIAGSQAVARAAAHAGIDRAVAISTDKAVDPVNTYGATKMIMERVWQEAARLYPTDFRIVRYGNVVSSTGSVIPMFIDQIRNDGRVQITSPAMSRFWLGIEGAVGLVESALYDTRRRRGSIYVARCPAANLTTVAHACATVAGLPMPEIQLIGIRPGEKVHEILMSNTEAQYAHPAGGFTRGSEIAIVPPALSQHGDPVNSTSLAYSSQAPDHTLTAEELAAFIAQSRRFEW